MPPQPGELTPRKAARILEVHPKTVLRMVEDGRISEVRRTYSGRIFIRREAIERLLDQKHGPEDML